jgi:diphthine synthase
LILLEVDVNRKEAVTISRGLEYLLKIEAKRRRGLLDERTLVIGAARIGCEDSLVKADLAGRLGKVDFGPPPHVIVLPGKLHFMEAEALKLFAGAPEEALEGSL